ncbi:MULTISPECIES: GGDEF domain-containing protein [unclassified Fibrobacter]|uniref:GGDEF domain-containing protein n=1 Tax=unclassified Fibrobacter TaxID=2634177 RepID=UPI000D79BD08|nr:MULTISPECIES: GGDEF domain-containing protein [unclassified Fibrobacter]PWJ59806.1 diguanylate cyclase (GGDEF)-like protein [Fibrobacter sp. UWR4]PZW63761.1 diguanylate cyclase (GGDEF)-like protein [Fibrobacter sp. UWR1]
MEHLINMKMVFVGNFIGLTLLVILFMENAWRLHRGNRNGENIAIMTMILTCAASCFLDPIAYYVDGLPGTLSRIVAFISNDILFLSYGVISISWVYFMAVHLEGKISRRHFIFLLFLVGFVVVMLVVNRFNPIAFEIDAQGNYTRKVGYFINLFVNAIIMTDGILLYARCRRKGGFMKSFPIAGYLSPLAAAVIVQSYFYGVSVISPSIAVGIASIIAGLKNEHAYRDEQTNLFNRSYLDAYFTKIVAKHRVTGFMIRLKNLDDINLASGFQEGDRSIVRAASFLNEAVGDLGVVARFSTDRFVVLLNTQADTIIRVLEDEIRNDFERFNRNNKVVNYAFDMCHVKLKKENSELFLMLNELNQLLK